MTEDHLNPFSYPTDMLSVYKAMRFAKKAHRGRFRWDESPEFHHLLSVASRCSKHGYIDTETIITAILHDVVEDTSVTLAMVHDVFGEVIADNVDRLTQRKGETRHDYFARCMSATSPVVFAVKFADRCDNVAGLHTCPDLPEYEKHVDTYFEELESYFMPHLSRVNESLGTELIQLVERAREYFDAPVPQRVENIISIMDRFPESVLKNMEA